MQCSKKLIFLFFSLLYNFLLFKKWDCCFADFPLSGTDRNSFACTKVAAYAASYDLVEWSDTPVVQDKQKCALFISNSGLARFDNKDLKAKCT